MEGRGTPAHVHAVDPLRKSLGPSLTFLKMAAVTRVLRSSYKFRFLAIVPKHSRHAGIARSEFQNFMSSAVTEDKQETLIIKPQQTREDVTDRKIFISKLGKLTDEATLQQYFSNYGEIDDLTIGRTKLTGRSRGFAFVTFKQIESIGRVLRDVHRVDGWLLDVMKAVPQSAQREKAKRVRYTQDQSMDDNIIHIHCPPAVSRERVIEHFSQFGAVEKVVGLEASSSAAVKQDAKRHCFVHFSSPEAVAKALSLEQQNIDSSAVRVRRYVPNLAHVKATRKIVVKPLPHDITVDDIKQYFEKFGRVQAVDLFLGPSEGAKELQGIAYVSFSSMDGASNATGALEHTIFGDLVTVKKYALSFSNKEKNRLKKVFVEGLPVNVSIKELKALFSEFGKVNRIKYPLFEKAPKLRNCCTITFSNVDEVEKLLQNAGLELHGKTLKVRRLRLQFDEV